jgi:hypothetical protein
MPHRRLPVHVARQALGLAVAALLAAPAAAVEPGLRIHADEFPLTPLTRVVVGMDAGAVPISSLTTAPSYPNGAALEAGTVWDFSGVTGGDVVVQTAPVAPGWSCYVPEAGLAIPDLPCGFDQPENDLLLALETVDTDGRDVAAIDFDGVGTYFLRAWAIDEGDTPATGEQELRLCLQPRTGRPEVPFLVFPNVDGARRYMAAGDPQWMSDEFDCSTGFPIVATLGAPCGTAGGQSALLQRDAGSLGRFTGRVAGAGTVTLPSGHVLDTLLVEFLASFNAAAFPPLCFDGGRTRQYQLLWLLPGYGPIVQVRSTDDQNPDLTTWTTTSSTVIGYGLLPPLTVRVDSVTSTTMTVSWDPGRVTRFIDGYEVQWGTQSGATGPLPNRSAVLPAAAGTSFTITGLSPDTSYFVSVATVRSYMDPRARVTTEYRSLSLPETVGADVDGDGTRDTSYPPEASARTSVAGPADLAVNRSVRLLPAGPTPPVASAFAAGCRVPPHALCAEETVPGALDGLVLMGEAARTGVPSLRFYEHSDAVDTMKLRRAGDDLVFSST